jgi:hypothetical protein
MTGSPEEQAEEALREAVRKINAGMCPVCGRTDPHGDESHWTTGNIVAGTITGDMISRSIIYPECSEGPDCQCPFHFHMRAQDAAIRQVMGLDAAEAELRARRREIAEAQSGWQPGTCTKCGLDDGDVKGPAGAELCKWCDELRILAPAPAPPKPPERQQRRRLDAGERATVVSLLITLAGVTIVMFGGWWPLGVALWALGLLYGTRRR